MNIKICDKATAWIREEPTKSIQIGKKESQIIYGEEIIIEREEGEFAFGRSAQDGYGGYIKLDSLSEPFAPTTHKVSIPITYVFRSPTFKMHPVKAYPMLSKIPVGTEEQDGFIKLESEKPEWIFKDHVMPIDDLQKNYVKTALLYLNAPYIYGGQAIGGIDCSGLVRIALLHAGIDCPRDCDRQVKALEERPGGVGNMDFRRGDIVYFDGHVGIMLNEKFCLNATARHMKTLVEKIDDLIEVYGAPTGIKNFLPVE